MAVVIYHFRGAMEKVDTDWIWPFLETKFSYGYLSVEMFFVISEFVISSSILKAHHTLGLLVRFAVRRSIRLDPTYWATIAPEITAIYVRLWGFLSWGPGSPQSSTSSRISYTRRRFLVTAA